MATVDCIYNPGRTTVLELFRKGDCRIQQGIHVHMGDSILWFVCCGYSILSRQNHFATMSIDIHIITSIFVQIKKLSLADVGKLRNVFLLCSCSVQYCS